MLKDDNNIVRSVKHGGYSNWESGITWLIWTVCKTVQDKGCEKVRAYGIFWNFYERGIWNIRNIFISLSGKQINISFLNGAGIFYLYEKLEDFFKKTDLDKLLSPVHYDLDVLAYCLECRALGLIEKLVTRPLWKIISKEKHLLICLHTTKICYHFWVVSRWCFCFYERW